MFVYFARCNDHIKIGISRNVYQRIKVLATANVQPISLEAQMAGGLREEEMLHRAFRYYHQAGEWFRDEGDLADLLEVIRPYKDDPYAARGAADQWWADNIGIGPHSLGNNRWTVYAKALEQFPPLKC